MPQNAIDCLRGFPKNKQVNFTVAFTVQLMRLDASVTIKVGLVPCQVLRLIDTWLQLAIGPIAAGFVYRLVHSCLVCARRRQDLDNFAQKVQRPMWVCTKSTIWTMRERDLHIFVLSKSRSKLAPGFTLCPTGIP